MVIKTHLPSPIYVSVINKEGMVGVQTLGKEGRSDPDLVLKSK